MSFSVLISFAISLFFFTVSSAGLSSAQDNQILPNDSDLDLSDDEFGFSLGGTPQLMNTSGRIETTHGLQNTSTDARLPQPVAQLESKDRDFKAEIEAAKTLLFGFSSLADSFAPNPTDSHPANTAAPQTTRSRQKSKLNSKRPYSDSEEEASDEDLGFGDSDYFKDKKFAYPPLSDMVDDEKSNWKPGMKKKKSEKVDATWNPKSKVVKSPVKEIRPQRVSARLSTSMDRAPSLLNAPLPNENEKSSSPFSPIASPTELSDSTQASTSHASASAGSAGAVGMHGPSTSQGNANQGGSSKRGRHKAVSTTKQRLAKILKLDKSGRYKR